MVMSKSKITGSGLLFQVSAFRLIVIREGSMYYTLSVIRTRRMDAEHAHVVQITIRISAQAECGDPTEELIKDISKSPPSALYLVLYDRLFLVPARQLLVEAISEPLLIPHFRKIFGNILSCEASKDRALGYSPCCATSRRALWSQ